MIIFESLSGRGCGMSGHGRRMGGCDKWDVRSQVVVVVVVR
jgi:hypothetical protein